MRQSILLLCLLSVAAFGSAAASDCWNDPPTQQQPRAGWETVDFNGLNRAQLLAALGCPPHHLRMTSARGRAGDRELWVYHPNAKDSTGLYLWLKGGMFHASRLDTFSGFWTHEMDNPDFWD